MSNPVKSLILSVLILNSAAARAESYTIAIKPQEAVLGEEITATLHCVHDAQPAISLNDASLTLRLRYDREAEPAYAFPNRRVIIDDDLILREAPTVPSRRLSGPEDCSRDFELTRLFPAKLLNAGQSEFSFTIYDGDREWSTGPVWLRVISSVRSIDRLLARLDDSEADVRRRSATLLHRMTAQGFDYDPAADSGQRRNAQMRWAEWWHLNGSGLKWDQRRDSALCGKSVTPSSQSYGALAYRCRSLGAEQRFIWVAALQKWLENPSFDRLQAQLLIGDREFSYPTDALLIPDAEMKRLLTRALDGIKMTESAQAASVVLATVARMPETTFFQAVSRLVREIPASPEWSSARSYASGLLDLLSVEK